MRHDHNNHKSEETEPLASNKEPESSPSCDNDVNKEKDKNVITPPADPRASIPDNQKTSLLDHPYIVCIPVKKSTISNPFKGVTNMFSSWTRKASDASQNVWHNLKMGPSVSKTACGKVKLAAKAVSKGGFRSIFKQNFATEPNEKLRKTFACYLSTSAGPVAGTLYLSTARIGFHSDSPLSIADPTGQQAWCNYQVMIPWEKMSSVNPVTNDENPQERFIEMATVDGHSFWLMGFVNYEKALHNILDGLSGYRAAEFSSGSAGP
ncbi:GEM-like protein [Drosera capensis]